MLGAHLPGPRKIQSENWKASASTKWKGRSKSERAQRTVYMPKIKRLIWSYSVIKHVKNSENFNWPITSKEFLVFAAVIMWVLTYVCMYMCVRLCLYACVGFVTMCTCVCVREYVRVARCEDVDVDWKWLSLVGERGHWGTEHRQGEKRERERERQDRMWKNYFEVDSKREKLNSKKRAPKLNTHKEP